MQNEYVVLFVYGTLRKGRGNHHYMQNSEFIGYGILKGWAFCSGGLTVYKRDCSFVIGEVYRVPMEDFLGPIDSLEGYPSGYARTIEKVIIPGIGVVDAWVYHYEVNPNMCTPEVSFNFNERI